MQQSLPLGVRSVVFTGSRSAGVAQRELVRELLLNLPAGCRIAHGGARGLDTIVDELARELKFDVYVDPVIDAEWRALGGRAGPLRNIRMLNTVQPDLVIAVWDRISPGTKHCAQEARKRRIPVKWVYFKPG